MSKRTLRLAITGGVLLLAMAFHAPLLAGLMVISGRSRHCNYEHAQEAFETSARQDAFEKELRAASKQIGEDGELVQFETPMGKYWIPKTSAGSLFYDLAEQKRGIYSYNGRGVKPGDVVIDAGANIGIYSKVALEAGASKVIAIEPSPENLECLRRNLQDEIVAGKAVVVAKGVWDKDDFLPMFVNKANTAGNSFVRAIPGSEKVEVKLPLTTLDKLVTELGLDRVDYMKMDIEGAERNALRGGKAMLTRFKPRLAICVYHMEGDAVEVPKAVLEANGKYQQECGACLVANGRVNPQVFYFY